MPQVKSTAITTQVPHPQKVYWGETPLTRFLDLHESVRVELLHEPDRETLLPVIAEMLEATHAHEARPVADLEAVRKVLHGDGLWGAQEVTAFTLRVTGVSRKFTHQLVRARVGVTFFQQCTGDQDLRHCDILVPRPWRRYEMDLRAYEGASIEAKMLYAEVVDRKDVPVHEASYLLPHSISTFIYLHATLAALVNLYQRRVCTMTNLWEMVLFARQIPTLVLAHWPETFPLFFPTLCQARACWYQRNKFAQKNTSWWTPDEAHDSFNWKEESFDYVPHEQASDPPVTPAFASLPRYYLGRLLISPENWARRKGVAHAATA